jgi:hypothetical protein
LLKLHTDATTNECHLIQENHKAIVHPTKKLPIFRPPQGHLESEFVTRIRLHRRLDIRTAKLSIGVRNRGQSALGRSICSRPQANIIGNSVAGHFPIVPTNILGRVLKHGAFNQDLGALAGIDAVGEDAVVVACDLR